MPLAFKDREPTRLEKMCPFLSVKPLAPYFEISTKQFLERFKKSLIPYGVNFYDEYKEKPDLYGPFWILTSLVLALFISGNISRYIEWEGDAKDFEYNYKVIPMAMGILYGTGALLPLLLKVALNLYGTNEHVTPLATTVGIYGYSFSTFLITSVLCTFAVDWLQWILIGYSAIVAGVFITKALWEDLKNSLEPKYRWVAIAFLGTIQMTLLLIFKLYFFQHVKKV